MTALDNSDAFPQDSSRTEIETNSSTTDENINQTITANNTSNIDTSLEEKENSNSDVPLLPNNQMITK